MLPDGAVGEELVAFGNNIAQGRKVKWIDDLKTGGQFPAEKKRGDADDAEPVGDNLAAALPQPVGG